MIAEQDNPIKTSYTKAKIDNTQKNTKCRLYDDREEMVNHLISKCSELPQKWIQEQVWLGRKGYPLGSVQETEIWPY